MAKRRYEPQPIKHNKKFTSVQEVDRAITKLKRRIAELKELEQSYDEHQVNVVRDSLVETLRDIYGAESANFEPYEYYRIWEGGMFVNMRPDYIERCERAGIKHTIIDIEGHIRRLEETREDLSAHEQAPTVQAVSVVEDYGNKVFIVHGQNDAVKYATSNLIHQAGLEPIILHEQPNGGRTIIEKLEHHANTGFAVILLTADDIGHQKDRPGDAKPRARQNVILELGFFMAKISRGRVCALYERGVELPSDFQGIVYIPLDASGAWKFALAKEMQNAGMPVILERITN